MSTRFKAVAIVCAVCTAGILFFYGKTVFIDKREGSSKSKKIENEVRSSFRHSENTSEKWERAKNTPPPDFFFKQIEVAEENSSGAELTEKGHSIVFEASNTLDMENFVLFTNGLVGTPLYEVAASLLASRFATEDPEEGLKWLLSQPSQAACSVFSQSMRYTEFPQEAFDLFKKNKRKSLSFLKGMIASADANTVQDVVKLIQSNPEFMQLLGQTDGTFLQGASDQFIEEKNIVSAIDVMSAFQEDSNERKAVAFRIFSSNHSDPSAAADSFSLLSNQKDRNAAIEGLVSRWVREEPQAAVAWINNLQKVDDIDAAKMTVSKTMIDIDLRDSAEWATSISNEGLRTSAIEQVLKRAELADPEFAQEFKDQLGQMSKE